MVNRKNAGFLLWLTLGSGAAVAEELPAFATLDQDGDGRLTREEFNQMRPAHGCRPGRRFERLDANGDGWIQKSEYPLDASSPSEGQPVSALREAEHSGAPPVGCPVMGRGGK